MNVRAIFLALVLVLLAGLGGNANAASKCSPASIDDVRWGMTFDGGWAYWWCTAGGVITYEWRAILIPDMTIEWTAAARAYAAGKNPDFVNTAFADASVDPAYDAIRLTVGAATASDTNKPVIVVAPPTAWHTPAVGTFRLYTASGGKLTGAIAGRTGTANAQCDSSGPPAKSGTSTYYPLQGGPSTEYTLCVTP